MNKITKYDLAAQAIPGQWRRAIGDAVQMALHGGPEGLISFFNHYATWNGNFAGCMTRLAADISEAKTLFVANGNYLRDRSNLVASYIFDTVRDEFDDSGTTHRDTHRTLAQAFIWGLIRYSRARYEHVDWERALAPKPVINLMLRELKDGFSPSGPLGLFEGIGFHLGSEYFGDAEYTTIDKWFINMAPDIRKFLQEATHFIDNVEHNCYSWVNIHSGIGKGVEEDHLQIALDGANKAIELAGIDKEVARAAILRGAHRFAKHQEMFFTSINFSWNQVMARKMSNVARGLVDDIYRGLRFRFSYNS